MFEEDATVTIFEVLSKNDIKCTAVCCPDAVQLISDSNVNIIASTSDEQSTDAAISALHGDNPSRFVWLQYNSIEQGNKTGVDLTTTMPVINNCCSRLFQNIPQSSMVIVLLGQGNTTSIDK